MKAASLKEQFINVITFNHERELWVSRPDQSFEEMIQPLLDDLIRIADLHKEGANFKMYQWDKEESLSDDGDLPHVIGRKIREIQDTKGWSLDKLAKKARLNKDYLRSVQRGESILGMCALENIAHALKVHSSELMPF